MLQRLVFATLFFFMAGAALAEEKSSAAISAERLREHISFLASDELAGREGGEPGHDVAADYIADRFRDLDLKPAGDNGTYYHHVPMTLGAAFGKVQGAVVTTRSGAETKWLPGSDVVPLGYGDAETVEAPGVFVGYGITATDEDKKSGITYDDYAGVDAKGKIAIVLRYVPREGRGDAPFGGRQGAHAHLFTKIRNARDHGAAGVILVSPPEPDAPAAPRGVGGNDLYAIAHGALPRQPLLPALVASREVLQEILQDCGTDLKSLVKQIDENLTPRSFDLAGTKLRFSTMPRTVVLRNVVAKLDGKDEALGRESIVIGAHYDHIGRFGGPAARREGRIYNGADDNASGVAGVLELARTFATQGSAPGRSLLFICFAGEELGFVGSHAWVDARRRFVVREETPRLPAPGTSSSADVGRFLAGTIVESMGEIVDGAIEVESWKTREKGWVRPSALEHISGPEPLFRIAAMVNLDMIGRATDQAPVSALDAGSSVGFQQLLEEISKTTGVPVRIGKGKADGSDHVQFRRHGIPVLFFFTGVHPQYHTPDDETSTINFEGERAVLELVRACVARLSADPARPPFNKEQLADTPRQRRRPRLGIEPDPGYAGEGVRVSRVLAGTPAAAAQMQAGDVIISLGEKPVRRFEDLLAALREAAESGVPVKVRRGDKEETLTVCFAAPQGDAGVLFGSLPEFSFPGPGVKFRDIQKDTPADKAGVKAGDILLRWNQEDVEDIEHWTVLLSRQKPGEEVLIRVRRGNGLLEFKVRLEARA